MSGQIFQATFGVGRWLRSKMLVCATDGVYLPQMHALIFIRERKGITMKELAHAFQVTSPSATALVDRLQGMGLVRRKHDSRNRKLVRLFITKDGEKVLRRKMAFTKQMIAGMLAGLSSGDQTTLLSLLRKVSKNCPHK